MPFRDAYWPKVEKWICTCPAFTISRFLISKRLTQHVHAFAFPVFANHPSGVTRTCSPRRNITSNYRPELQNLDLGCEGDEEDEEGGWAEEEEKEETTHKHDGRTFEEAHIDLIGLKHKSNSVNNGYSMLSDGCERMYTEGKEDELNKEFNVANMEEINKPEQCDVLQWGLLFL